MHNVDIVPGLITRALSMLQICFLSLSFMLAGAMCLFTSLSPLCIHGNSYLFGQLPTSEKCLVISMDVNHCKAHESKLSLVYQWELESSLDCISDFILV